MRFTGNYVPPSGGGVVQLGTGCLGDGTNATDLVLDIQGDGLTYGGGDDAIRVMNALPGASNLQIEGRANCGGRVAAAHQDGIQVLGGTNITFRNFEIGNYDAGLAGPGRGRRALLLVEQLEHAGRGREVHRLQPLAVRRRSVRPRLGRLVPIGPDRRHRPGLHRILRLQPLHGAGVRDGRDRLGPDVPVLESHCPHMGRPLTWRP